MTRTMTRTALILAATAAVACLPSDAPAVIQGGANEEHVVVRLGLDCLAASGRTFIETDTNYVVPEGARLFVDFVSVGYAGTRRGADRNLVGAVATLYVTPTPDRCDVSLNDGECPAQVYALGFMPPARPRSGLHTATPTALSLQTSIFADPGAELSGDIRLGTEMTGFCGGQFTLTGRLVDAPAVIP